LQWVVLPAFHVKLLGSGPFAGRFGIQLWFLIAGISCLPMGLLGFFFAYIMKMENKPAEDVQHVISTSA
jgi:hypothetical protein